MCHFGNCYEYCGVVLTSGFTFHNSSRYLYAELYRVYSDQPSTVFDHPDTTGKCAVKPEVKFHFYTSHTPCKCSHYPVRQENILVCKTNPSKVCVR